LRIIEGDFEAEKFKTNDVGRDGVRFATAAKKKVTDAGDC